MKWLRKNWITILLIVILLAGLGLLLYPSVANYWNSFHQSRAIAGYADAVAGLDAEEYARILSEAQAYNEEMPDNMTQMLAEVKRTCEKCEQ